jgi:transcriptional repressor NrdR
MKCSVCSSPDHRVMDTVETDDAIRRRRKCERCGHRWTTFERDEGAGALDRKAALASLAALQAALGREG